MREIKFRVRCKKTKVVVYCDSEGVVLIPDTGQLYGDGGLNVTDYYYLEQYTGLKDMSGVEIYEGDIVEYDHCTGIEVGVVKYEPVEFFISLGFDYVGMRPSRGLKVLGNIHENPEIVKG